MYQPHVSVRFRMYSFWLAILILRPYNTLQRWNEWTCRWRPNGQWVSSCVSSLQISLLLTVGPRNVIDHLLASLPFYDRKFVSRDNWTIENYRISNQIKCSTFKRWTLLLSSVRESKYQDRDNMKHPADHMHRLDLLVGLMRSASWYWLLVANLKRRLSRKKSWKSCAAGFEAFCLAPMIRVSWSRCGWLESLEGLDVVSLFLLGFAIVMICNVRSFTLLMLCYVRSIRIMWWLI